NVGVRIVVVPITLPLAVEDQHVVGEHARLARVQGAVIGGVGVDTSAASGAATSAVHVNAATRRGRRAVDELAGVYAHLEEHTFHGVDGTGRDADPRDVRAQPVVPRARKARLQRV